MKIWDIIVIGAGPAGSTAAQTAAVSGLQVLIIDKDDFPREKPCGGGLSPGAYRELRVNLPEELIENICYGMRSAYRKKVNIIEDESPVAYMINRKKFDSYLLNRAIVSGARFYKRKCRKVTESDDFVTIETDKGKYRSRYCIGADGYFSKTAGAVRKPFSCREIRFCLISEIPVAEHPIITGAKPLVELDFGYLGKGYGWLFPKSKYISTGMGGDSRRSLSLKQQFLSFLEEHNLPPPGNITGCFIPVSNLRHRVNTDRIMLTGDAAGFVDSFSGEGIKNALVSGRIAAETVISVINTNKSVKRYKKAVYREMASDLRWSEKINSLSCRFEDQVFGNLLGNKKIMKKYFDVLRGNKSYRSFFFGALFSYPLIVFKNFISHHFS